MVVIVNPLARRRWRRSGSRPSAGAGLDGMRFVLPANAKLTRGLRLAISQEGSAMSDQEQEQEQEPRWDARGMVEAFVNHVRSPKRGHGGSLALAAVLALVVASGAAFAFGMFTRTHDAGRTGDAQTASSDPPLRVTAADRFVALTGYGCPTSSQAGFSLQGTYSDGIDGFVPVAAGGWTK